MHPALRRAITRIAPAAADTIDRAVIRIAAAAEAVADRLYATQDTSTRSGTVRTLPAQPGPVRPAVDTAIRQAPAPAVQPFADDEMPALSDIETAAVAYTEAADKARSADRAKRKARQLLGRLPAGIYGGWIVDWVESSRLTPDLDAIRATYEAHGLGPVPMRTVAASLQISAVPAAEVVAA
jgi:hypothetical protein